MNGSVSNQFYIPSSEEQQQQQPPYNKSPLQAHSAASMAASASAPAAVDSQSYLAQYTSSTSPAANAFPTRYMGGAIGTNPFNPHFQPHAPNSASANANPAAAAALFDQGPYQQAPPMPTHSYSYPGPPMRGAHVSPRRRLSEHAGNTVYSFVPLPGAQQQKRPRRRFEEIERIYHCNFEDCTKAYGTLNHLNAHVTMQKHGPKRTPEEFKETRREYKARKKEEEKQLQLMRAAAASDSRSSISSTGSNPRLSPTVAYQQRPYMPLKTEMNQYSTVLDPSAAAAAGMDDPTAPKLDYYAQGSATLPPMGLHSSNPYSIPQQPQPGAGYTVGPGQYSMPTQPPGAGAGAYGGGAADYAHSAQQHNQHTQQFYYYPNQAAESKD